MAVSNAVFMDTGGWVALLNKADRFYSQAASQMQEIGTLRRPLITTDWVFAETGNSLARTAARDHFVQTVQAFLVSGNSHFIRIDEELFHLALDLYRQASDKTWGLVDCASFVVMRREGAHDAMSADRHFQQAGFRCLLPTA